MRVARGTLGSLRWPLQPLKSRRLYLRGALLGAFLSVFATGALATGGIVPAAVSAPDVPPQPRSAVLNDILAPEAPEPFQPPYITTAPITPGADFVRDTLRTRAPFVPSGSLSEQTISAYALLAGWPSTLIDEVLDVAWCESRYDPLAVNGYMRGLMQVNTLWFDYSSTDRDHWDDPLVNLRVARAVYLYDIARGNQPWAQWECKPGGQVLAASAHINPVSTLPPEDPSSQDRVDETPTPQDPAQAGTDGAAAPSPSATPAPWELKPSWPPKYDRAPDSPTPAP